MWRLQEAKWSTCGSSWGRDIYYLPSPSMYSFSLHLKVWIVMASTVNSFNLFNSFTTLLVHQSLHIFFLKLNLLNLYLLLHVLGFVLCISTLFIPIICLTTSVKSPHNLCLHKEYKLSFCGCSLSGKFQSPWIPGMHKHVEGQGLI